MYYPFRIFNTRRWTTISVSHRSNRVSALIPSMLARLVLISCYCRSHYLFYRSCYKCIWHEYHNRMMLYHLFWLYTFVGSGWLQNRVSRRFHGGPGKTVPIKTTSTAANLSYFVSLKAVTILIVWVAHAEVDAKISNLRASVNTASMKAKTVVKTTSSPILFGVVWTKYRATIDAIGIREDKVLTTTPLIRKRCSSLYSMTPLSG